LASREEGEPEATLPELSSFSSASTTHAAADPQWMDAILLAS
jgi:hypothetical protein